MAKIIFKRTGVGVVVEADPELRLLADFLNTEVRTHSETIDRYLQFIEQEHSGNEAFGGDVISGIVVNGRVELTHLYFDDVEDLSINVTDFRRILLDYNDFIGSHISERYTEI